MPLIGRKIYHQAMEEILKKVGCQYKKIKLGKILVHKRKRKLFVEIAGKNLPYFGKYEEEAFLWETHLRPERLDRIEAEAKDKGAEAWIAFCYAILKSRYICHFNPIASIDDIDFGAKLIKINDYRKYMKDRSPSWRVVDLPRERVLEITKNPEDI